MRRHLTPERSCNAQNTKVPIYCGRPHQHSIPPSLLDETLCQLRYDIQSITPTPKDIQCYDTLCASASQLFAKESDRWEQFTDILTAAGVLPARPTRWYNSPGYLRTRCLDVDVVFYVQKISCEIGTAKADPYMEVMHHWVENVENFFDSYSASEDGLASQLNFPAVLVMHFGPYLAIAAAVYGCDPIVEHLCCIPLHVHETNEAALAAGDRAIAALRVALHSLQERYSALPERGPRADFPFRNFYVDDSGTRHEFTYVSSIDESQRLFRVVENGTPLRVKFSSKREALKVPYDAGSPPALRAMNEVYDWVMVVMDDPDTTWDVQYVEKWKGRNLKSEKGSHAVRSLTKPAVSFEEVQKQVEAKLKVLRDMGLVVHGNVRGVNVLIRNEDASEDNPYIPIVDWDWAGHHNRALTPAPKPGP